MVSGHDRCRVNSLVKLPDSSPVEGVVRCDPTHSLWNGATLAGSLLLAPMLFSWGALAICLVLSGTTLLLGHSVGFHRRLIHRSFDCPLWLERLLVWAGTLVGMSGPLWMIRTHDLRDWRNDGPTATIIWRTAARHLRTLGGRCTAGWS